MLCFSLFDFGRILHRIARNGIEKSLAFYGIL
ncbi:hypothetical protein ROS217_10227 [Roseovarius sp. 217]|nr:hypothetical protein ROS217_10227 [Roseovarius sp. 217]